MIKRVLLSLLVYPLCIASVSAEDPALKTDQQKASYAIGLQIVQNLMRQDIKLDEESFNLGIKDALSNHAPRLSPEEVKASYEWQQGELQKQRQAKADQNLTTGKNFLAENKKKDGVKELPSGLQYKVLTEGKGKKPTTKDTITVHYQGTLIDGKEFDSSRKRGEPATFELGNVIQGWQEVLPLMQEGAKWQVFIPPNLAYGERGSPGGIGPNETLIFEIELISIAAAKPEGDAAAKPAPDKAKDKK